MKSRLATERNELLGVAVLAAHAQEALFQAAALQVRIELLLEVVRQWSACFGSKLSNSVVKMDDIWAPAGATISGAGVLVYHGQIVPLPHTIKEARGCHMIAEDRPKAPAQYSVDWVC
jgi:hypothetical protein